MSKGPYPFKETDIRRALRAARKEGVDVKIDIKPNEPCLSIVMLKSGMPADAGNDLDKWLEEHREGSAQGN